MALETGTFISDFNASNPAHSDGLSQADSHMRWIKSAILASFPGITGALTATHTQINSAVAAVVSGTSAALHFAGTLANPGISFIGNTACGLYASGTNALAVVTNGAAAITISAAQAVGIPGALTAGSVASTGSYSGGTGQLGIVGEPRLWLSDTLPSGNFGWLNGQAISRTGNPILFALWGTKYGAGDGSTTFNVPNFQEVVPVGKNGMGAATSPGLISATGVNANIGTVGDIVGEGAHTLAQAELPNVNFTVSGITLHDPGHVHLNQGETWAQTQGGGAGGGGGGQPFMNPGTSGGNNFNSNSATTGITVQTQGSAASGGSGTAANICQPGIVCNWITLLG